MASSDIYSLSLLLFFAAFQFSGAANDSCDAFCGNQLIRFPFKLNTQPDHCGYPGFNLSCINGQTILSLPFSGNFNIMSIHYSDQSIWLHDPANCIPNRLLNSFTVAGTPFQYLSPQNFIFFNCSSGDGWNREFGVVDCLSNEKYTVLALHFDFYSQFRMQSCSEIAMVTAPDFSVFGLGIIWDEPDCRICERKGGKCRFSNNTGLEIGCSGGSRNGLSKGVRYGLIFGLGVGLPILLIVALIIALRDKLSGRNRSSVPTSFAVALSQLNSKGLDERTIQSYPSTVLGWSRRLPKPDNSTCAICLSEYKAKETLRTIPKCQHYFHARCLDEWLRLNVTCPLCRN